MNKEEETYLAKWLNGTLDDETLIQFKKSEEYKDYAKIVHGLEYFHAPSFDTQQSLETTFQKIQSSNKKKEIRFRPFYYAVAMAASILLILGLFFSEVTYSADPAKQLAVELPDGSKAMLNSGSILTHKRFFWSQNRNVDLEGEALFTVTKGSTFTVQTVIGSIDVLGTVFNVRSRKKNLEVACYEGKVSVRIPNKKQEILTKGDKITLIDNVLSKQKTVNLQPLWTKGESRFVSITLGEVLDELERQYAVTISRHKIDEQKLFTGAFIHTNLELALTSVLSPMQIGYTIKASEIILWSQ